MRTRLYLRSCVRISEMSASNSNLSESDAMKIRVKAISEIRERLGDRTRTSINSFLRFCFLRSRGYWECPRRIQMRSPGLPPTMLEDSNHTLRNVTLEVLNRLPTNEFTRRTWKGLLSICSHVLSVDNEENALIALRIIFDLHKNYRPDLDKKVQPFLDLVRKLYASVPETVKSVFGDGTSCFFLTRLLSQSY